MAKKALLTVDAVHRKVKKGFVTDDARTHRKVRKAFITVGGVHRPCWSGGELAYYGTITGLSQARYWLAATSVGNHALFAGGTYASTVSDTVDAYDESLTRTSPTKLGISRCRLTGCSSPNRAMFIGGANSSSASSGFKYGDFYNTSLTRTHTSCLSKATWDMASARVGNYAVFAGGRQSRTAAMATVRAFNDSDDATPEALTVGGYLMAGASVGDYALFAGGSSSGSCSATAEAYNKSLTHSIPSNGLSVARYSLEATTIGNYALFAGGVASTVGSPIPSVYVDAFDKSLVRTTLTALTVGRYDLSATTLGNYAVFGNGRTTRDDATKTVYDIYDASLTKTTITTTRVIGINAATTIGNYALFGGGYHEFNTDQTIVDTETNVVEAFTIA